VTDATRPENVLKSSWRDESGQKWARQQARTDAQLGPLGLPAIEALALQPGERVLDVGCGAGQTLFQLAERVAPDGWVTGLDISEPLLELARQRIATSGHRPPRIDVVLGDAERAHLEPAYDALFSRFGVMFFEDPAAAFRNLARSLRPGGRAAFLCWQRIEENPWATGPLEAVRALAPEISLPEMLLPDAPGPFRFGDPDLVRRYLSTAGWQDIVIAPAVMPMAVGGARTVEEAVAFALEIGPTARFIGGLPPDKRPLVPDALRAVFEPALTEDGVRMKASTFVITARHL
jgi:SAM-dependent methyltransferase